jgi:hypothetical protein
LNAEKDANPLEFVEAVFPVRPTDPALTEQPISVKRESVIEAELIASPNWSVRRKTGCVEKRLPAVTVPAWMDVIQERIEALAAETTTLEVEQTVTEPNKEFVSLSSFKYTYR